jgi:glycosyltransferase involved in cell wall biosynthesis
MMDNTPENQLLIGSIKKPKIGFYLENRTIADADIRFPEKGNPGIGGSEFGAVSVPYFLSLYHQDIETVIYANVIENLPNRLACIQADDSSKAARKAIQDNCQILVVRHYIKDLNPDFIRAVSASCLKVVAWAHNLPSSQDMDIITSCANISRLVCVGREELDLLRDHPVIYKTTCVYNGIYPPLYTPENHIPGTGTTVVYLGALVKDKGFHVLARVWPKVKERVPNACLKVIGSGKVYNENSTLGLWGIADEDYEREFRPFLSDENGFPDASVTFLGKLGAEKIPIMQQADIGVVNPNLSSSGGTETFCYSAVEFQACGTPVVSVAEDGLLDTVINRRTGLLARGDRSLVRCIVRLLRNRELRERYGRNAMEFVQLNFDNKIICHQWHDLFLDVVHDRPNKVFPMKRNIFYHNKLLLETMRVARLHIPMFRTIPSISGSNKKRVLSGFIAAINLSAKSKPTK